MKRIRFSEKNSEFREIRAISVCLMPANAERLLIYSGASMRGISFATREIDKGHEIEKSG